MRPLSGEQRAYLFFAAFFFPPLAFFAIEDSSLHWWIARSGFPPAHSAAWHVGPALDDLASWANSRSQDATQESSNSVR